MLFCSQQFLLFFAVVFTAYWALPWQRAQVVLLLAASFYFYASWSHRLALLVCGAIATPSIIPVLMMREDGQTGTQGVALPGTAYPAPRMPWRKRLR